MTELNTKPFLDAGSALRDAIMADYRDAAAEPGASGLYRTLEYNKGRDHVDLGLLRGALGELDAFQAAIKSLLADPILAESLPVAESVLTEGSPLRDRYDEFIKHLKSSYQPTADGNQLAVGMVRGLSTAATAALVLKTISNVAKTSEWLSAMHDAIARWESSLSTTSRRLFASTALDLTSALDTVADALQSRGMLRLARDLDTVSDLLDQ